MIPLDPPRFPVIIPTPSLTDAVKNFRVTEYLSVGAVTTASGVFGYAIGEPANSHPALPPPAPLPPAPSPCSCPALAGQTAAPPL